MKLTGEFEPKNLNPAFPVSRLFNELRGDVPPIKAHVHDCFEIGYCHEGSGVFMVEDKLLPCKGGDAVVINNKELHLLVASPGLKCRWSFLNLEPAGLLAGYIPSEEACLDSTLLSGPDFCNIMDGEKDSDICLIIREIIAELSGRKDGYKSVVRALVWSLMAKLHRKIPELKAEEENSQKKRNSLQRIQPALQYIAEHYQEDINIEKLAKLSYSSVSNFRKIFHAGIGCSPMDYLINFRMEVARTLLKESEYSILKVALNSGFPSLSNFNRQFLKQNGISPRKWRTGDK